MTVTATRYATVNTVPLDTYAWRVIAGGYDQLLNTPQVRGEDVIMPGATGVRAYPRIFTATIVSIPMLIVGSMDDDGAPISDPFEGMLQHQEYLQENLGIAEDGDADRGTVEMVFVRGGALSSWTGEVTVLGLQDWVTLDGQTGEAMVRLDISIPAGRLGPDGS